MPTLRVKYDLLPDLVQTMLYSSDGVVRFNGEEVAKQKLKILEWEAQRALAPPAARAARDSLGFGAARAARRAMPGSVRVEDAEDALVAQLETEGRGGGDESDPEWSEGGESEEDES